MAKLFLAGEAETIVIILAPIISQFISFCGPRMSFIITDPLEMAKTRFSTNREIQEKRQIHREFRKTLEEMRDRPGISAQNRQKHQVQIEELDNLFSESLNEDARARWDPRKKN